MRPCAVALLLVLLTPGWAIAHSLGASLEKVDGDYLVDIGYDSIVLTDSNSAIFDFGLRDARTASLVAFDHAWVRIVHESGTVFATGLKHQKFGPTTLLYRFPQAGEYTLDVSYRTEEGRAIAQASFPLEVASEDSLPVWLHSLFFAATLVIVVTYASWRRRG